MSFPLHLHEMDVSTFNCLKFTMPPSEVGRDDIEVTVEYGEAVSGENSITFNAWARIGASRIKGFIHTGTIKATGDVVDGIMEALNANPAFTDMLNQYIAHMTQR